MPHLNLALLGPFQLTLEDPIDVRVESDKTRGLLAFLAVEHDRPHSRAALAELLWPAYSEQAAAANFRRVLANLRAVIDDRGARIPHLRITRTTVQFDPASDAVVDVLRLRDLLKTPATTPMWAAHMKQDIALYRGPFLEGFTLRGCLEFEQWVVDVRSELDRLVAEAFHDLADHCWDQGDVTRALALYRRSLLLNPYHETVHRKIMLAYAAAGQRQDVRSHYEAYKRQLQDELGAQPEAQTTSLYKTLHAGQAVQIEAPGLLETHTQLALPQADPDSSERKDFVGREEELALMHECVRKAASNHGAILLVVGEAGNGKTALLHEFARRLAGAAQPWLVAIAASTALFGVGDPYQPVVDALRMLVAGEAGVPRPFSSAETLRLLQEEAPDWAALALAGPASGAVCGPLHGQRRHRCKRPRMQKAEG
ncbi:MAG: AAA family ATPase [Anaerolineales bacterium]|nr:AAA family ATPase [Anaerolineales bacterium]